MEWNIIVFICAWWCSGHIAGFTGGANIEQGQDYIDIKENTAKSITCSGLSENDIVDWKILRGGSSERQLIAKCTSSDCTLHLPGQFEVKRSPTQSELVYQQQNRTEDKNTKLTCRSENNSSTTEQDYPLNVISPAILSGCVVEEDDRDNGTVKGRCRFEHAYSAQRKFTCTWLQTNPSDQAVTKYDGVINKEEYTSNRELYYKGECTLSISPAKWDVGTYSYSIDFYPGPGRQPVPIGSLDTSPEASEKDPLPVAAIVGGAVAVVFLIVFIVIVAVVVTRRRKRPKPRRSNAPAAVPGKTPVADDDDWNSDWEEHTDHVYSAVDDDEMDLKGNNFPPNTASAAAIVSTEETNDTCEAVDPVNRQTGPAKPATAPTSVGAACSCSDARDLVGSSSKKNTTAGTGRPAQRHDYSEANDVVGDSAFLSAAGHSNASSPSLPAGKVKVTISDRATPEAEKKAGLHLQFSAPDFKKPSSPAEVTDNASSDNVYNRLDISKLCK